MTIPGKDIALATRFATYEAADTMAGKIQADDPEWTYGIRRLPTAQFVIDVRDEEGEFLGYL